MKTELTMAVTLKIILYRFTCQTKKWLYKKNMGKTAVVESGGGGKLREDEGCEKR